MRRRRLERHREKIYIYLKKWRISNLDKSRLKQRLTYWRGQQAKLAEQEFIKQIKGGEKWLEQNLIH